MDPDYFTTTFEKGIKRFIPIFKYTLVRWVFALDVTHTLVGSVKSFIYIAWHITPLCVKKDQGIADISRGKEGERDEGVRGTWHC